MHVLVLKWYAMSTCSLFSLLFVSCDYNNIHMVQCEELGRPPRRDEMFIKTHTHKNGVPHRGAATTIVSVTNTTISHAFIFC